MKEYDAIIVGGGAGLKIARPAANLGYKIAVIEEGPLGGTCLNRGCIPSKMLIHPADVIQQIRESDQFNIHVKGEITVDFDKLVEYVSKTIDQDAKSIDPALTNHKNIDFYRTKTHFVKPKVLEVLGRKITAKKIFLTVGARPHIPNIEGLRDTPFITSTELLRETKKPKKCIVLGAGYIACELGHYLDSMGVDTHFIVRSKYMRTLDGTIQKHFQEVFDKRFRKTCGEPHKVEYKNGEFKVYINNEVLVGDTLLVATGVTPNSDRLNLSCTNIKCDERGFIPVDDYLETSEKGVYAYGDIIGRELFRHSANFEGEYAFKTYFSDPKNKKPLKYTPVPYGVFTWPQIGGVGKTEEELIESKTDYLVGINPYIKSAMGMALRKDEGLVKLLFDKKSLKLIGGHIVGEHATDMIHMIIAYMNMNADLHDLLKTIYIHPALSENIRNAARKVRAQL